MSVDPANTFGPFGATFAPHGQVRSKSPKVGRLRSGQNLTELDPQVEIMPDLAEATMEMAQVGPDSEGVSPLRLADSGEMLADADWVWSDLSYL